MKKSIFALARNQTHAEKILNRLYQEGFKTEFVSVLIFDKTKQLTTRNAHGELLANPDHFKEANAKKNKSVGHEMHTKAPEGAATGAVAGGIIGGALGLLVGLGALAIPGLGPFIAAGPIMAALGGSGFGGGLGLLVGGLMGFGLPEYEAKKYEDQLKAGRILVSVESVTDEDLQRARDLLEEEGAEEISQVSEQSA